ncbi:hypothetical protein [Marilutibacter alkalisoli]|uniref:Uncharacterized protein n=1 Tax=Marilutibacter alkalisoli TaxID=2591633 RepID=A0A514BUV3_9GAMM|nr:hypothetical protein [Lysobacter alkalisoli]QDH71142.1 hypothetical protein FKV23_14390 [Lysobacter alkalisoli]
MSRHSKIRRDARRKQAPDRPIRRLGDTLQPHAQLIDADGNVVGGAGLRDREWVMVLGGKALSGTESAAMMLAMLRHAVAVQADAGRKLELHVSAALDAAAAHEAMAAGKSLPQYLEMLEAERQERRAGDMPTTPDGLSSSAVSH